MLYVLERWLARLAASPHAVKFVLKGGMLLAALGARRPTSDADLLARHLANDEATVVGLVTEVAGRPVHPDDGVELLVGTVASQSIRDDALYAGVRVTMDCRVGRARVKLRLDVNFGDPITPPPRPVALPSQRPGEPDVVVLGYPVETVLAEKLSTAMVLGEANTRVRDFVDVYALVGGGEVDRTAVRAALRATTAHRNVEIRRLSEVIGGLAEQREKAYRAFKHRLGGDGHRLPPTFAEVVSVVVEFADTLVAEP
ncbi:nucleotidyl transferase AbiEii/AbiGii toxin family protein [Actinosynnema sp. NPDC091369]